MVNALNLSLDKIEYFERKIKGKLPIAMVEFYLSNNAQEIQDVAIGDYDLLSFSEITQKWESLERIDFLPDGVYWDAENDYFTSNVDGRIRNSDWFNPLWIPFASSGNGDYLCIDLAPTETGVVGQIIEFLNEESERNFISVSFEDLMLNNRSS